MAYGVDGLKPVDMIVGPGNQYVALAKKYVFGQVAIDCLAGPSEIVVAADDAAHPDWVALDLIAQAEHSPGVSILVTWYEPLVNEVHEALQKRLAKLSRGELARDSLERYGALVLAPDKRAAIDCVNALAPEHLHVQTRDPEAFAEDIRHAGAIFLGPFTPVAVGDYAAGPSHVLPTGGTARWASGLNANDFRKRTSIMRFYRKGLQQIAPDVDLPGQRRGADRARRQRRAARERQRPRGPAQAQAGEDGPGGQEVNPKLQAPKPKQFRTGTNTERKPTNPEPPVPGLACFSIRDCL
jgi:histidinol dehydrogenase